MRLSVLFGPYMAANVYNNTGERAKIERTLTPDQRVMPHIILTDSVDAENYRILRLQMPFVSYLSMSGLAQMAPVISDIANGSMSLEEAKDYFVYELPRDVSRQWLSQLAPWVRGLMETSSNVKMYSGTLLFLVEQKHVQLTKRLQNRYCISLNRCSLHTVSS